MRALDSFPAGNRVKGVQIHKISLATLVSDSDSWPTAQSDSQRCHDGIVWGIADLGEVEGQTGRDAARRVMLQWGLPWVG